MSLLPFVVLDAPFRCTGCHELKPVSQFRADPTKPRGHSTRCRACTKEAGAARRTNNAKMREERIADGDTKRCHKCGVTKLVADFPTDSAVNGGSSHRCSACADVNHMVWRSKNIEHVREKSRKRQRFYRKRSTANEKTASRRQRLKAKYGLTEAAVEAMRVAQNNRCSICVGEFSAKPRGKLCVCIDHDHDTGAVRALLCVACNGALGQFSDSPDIIRRALQYLEKHGRQ